MDKETQPTLNPGDVVVLSRPLDDAERTARYVVVEPRGDRVLIRLVCDMAIPPMECVSVGDVKLAE